MMRKDIGDYKLYVFDLDGTLYDQKRLRLIMAARLMFYYMLRPFKIRELMILRRFRKVKEEWTKNSSEEDIIKTVADDMNVLPKTVDGIVKKWIYENPLDVIRKTRDEKLLEWMGSLRKCGKKVVIFSDYPTKEKLMALSVTADGQYSPEDERVDELKPSPKGLYVIMEDFNVLPEDILMIGDRPEKDQESAKRAGVDCLILPRSVGRRDHEKYRY